MATTDSVAENDDLVTEILRRLPLKPLTRSKIVSKRWLSLISDLQSSFIFRPTSALFLQSLRFNPEFAFVPLDDCGGDDCFLEAPHFQALSQPNTIILHSSNGLVCYSKFGLYSDDSLLEYYVCNPTTKRSAKIPLQATVRNRRIRWGHFRFQHKLCNLNRDDLDIHFLGVYLAFENNPRSSSTHYRVVCVSEFNADLFNYEIKISVYRPEQGLWSEPMGPFNVPYGTCFTNGVFWNGGMFWVSKKEIVCFHISQGFLKVAGLPLHSSCTIVEYFGVSRAHLQIVVSERHRKGVLKVYEMEQDYSGWVIQYRCDLQPWSKKVETATLAAPLAPPQATREEQIRYTAAS